MPVEYGTQSNYSKEMRRWEPTHTVFGPPGRPYVFQEFPKRMYRADHVQGKGIEIVDAQNADDEQQEANLRSRGFEFMQSGAIDAARTRQTEFGRLAAEREWEIQHSRLSPKAIEEVRAVEAAAGAVHVPVIPEGPKKRGRKPRTTVS